MATWNTVLRSCALRINALSGATASALETTYTTVPLTSANFQSTIFSFTAVKDTLIDAESYWVQVAADTANHAWRRSITTQATGLAYGAEFPVTRIGVLGSVIDESSSEPCTLNQLEQVRDRVINPNQIWKVAVYWYAVNDQRIYHTVTTVAADICTYTRPSADSLTLTGNIILPDVAVPSYADYALKRLVRDDEFMTQAQLFGGYSDRQMSQIRAGAESINTTTEMIDNPPQEAAA